MMLTDPIKLGDPMIISKIALNLLIRLFLQQHLIRFMSSYVIFSPCAMWRLSLVKNKTRIPAAFPMTTIYQFLFIHFQLLQYMYLKCPWKYINEGPDSSSVWETKRRRPVNAWFIGCELLSSRLRFWKECWNKCISTVFEMQTIN